MAAAPQNANLFFKGLQSGKTYGIAMYCSDVVGAYNTMSLDGLAATTSPNFWYAPENVVLVDASVITGLTDTKAWKFMANDVSTGNILYHAMYLSSLATRPTPGIPYGKGTKISIVQV